MAFLVIGAIHQAVRGVQSGIQAHKDFKSPVQIIDPTSPIDRNTRAPVDRYGHAKEHHPVYGWVMKAEHKFNKGKGKERGEAGPSSERDVRMDKEEYENQRYEPQTGASPTAPPTYEAAISGPSMPSEQSQGSAAEYYQTTSHTDEKRSNEVPQSKGAPRGFEAPHQDSSSSSSDSDSDSDTDQAAGNPSNREIRKKERRVRRAERKLDRASKKAESNGDRKGERDLDMRKVERAAERLGNAQRRLEAAKASAS